MEQNKQNIILSVTPSKEGNYYSIVKSLCEICVLTHKLQCPCNKSSYFSQITLSMQKVGDNYPPLGFYSIPCISPNLDDDVMMLPQHLICMRVQRSVNILQEPRLNRVGRSSWVHSSIFILY